MKLRKGGMFFEHYNYFGCLIVVLCYGAIYLIVQFFKIENYDWLYAIPIGLLFLYSLINNDKNSESDKP